MNADKGILKLMGAGVLAALTASLCCITPILALVSGTSGLVSTFAWMEPARPYLLGATLSVLGFAWFLKLKPAAKTEDQCCDPKVKRSFWQSKKLLGIVTAFSVLMFAFPLYSGVFVSPPPKITDTATAIKTEHLDIGIEGMTCAACEAHIYQEVSQLPGIIEAEASYEYSELSVDYIPSLVSPRQIKQAIEKTGYSVDE